MSVHRRRPFGFDSAPRLRAAAGTQRPGAGLGNSPLHVHAVLGLPDGSVKGGHAVEAVVWPTVGVFVTGTAAPLPKAEDPGSGLELDGFADRG